MLGTHPYLRPTATNAIAWLSHQNTAHRSSQADIGSGVTGYPHRSSSFHRLMSIHLQTTSQTATLQRKPEMLLTQPPRHRGDSRHIEPESTLSLTCWDQQIFGYVESPTPSYALPSPLLRRLCHPTSHVAEQRRQFAFGNLPARSDCLKFIANKCYQGAD